MEGCRDVVLLWIVVGLCSLCGGSFAFTITAGRQRQKPSTPPHRLDSADREPYRVCYYTTWARYRRTPANMQPQDVDENLCSHIVMAFAWISYDGRLALHSEWEDQFVVKGLVSKLAMNPDLKILVAVGGQNFGSEPFRRVTASDHSRHKFVNSTLAFIRKWGLHGLDIDWEYPQWADRDKFTLLLRDLNDAFIEAMPETKGEKSLLTLAVPANREKLVGYDMTTISDYVDIVNLMTYDFHGPWENKTGHNAPMYAHDSFSMVESARLLAELGMPRKKIAIGLPTYGHSFQLLDHSNPVIGSAAVSGEPAKYTRTHGFYAYYEVCEFLRNDRTVAVWDYQCSVPFAYNENTWISFDDAFSLRKKVQWLLAEGYGGVMIWELGMDDFNGRLCHDLSSANSSDEYLTFPLLRVINDALGVKVIEPTTTSRPSPTLANSVLDERKEEHSDDPKEETIEENEARPEKTTKAAKVNVEEDTEKHTKATKTTKKPPVDEETTLNEEEHTKGHDKTTSPEPKSTTKSTAKPSTTQKPKSTTTSNPESSESLDSEPKSTKHEEEEEITDEVQKFTSPPKIVKAADEPSKPKSKIKPETPPDHKLNTKPPHTKPTPRPFMDERDETEWVENPELEKIKLDDQCDHQKSKFKDCRHFYTCNRGIQYEFECPDGTLFSKDRSECVWPYEAPECQPIPSPIAAKPQTTPKSVKSESASNSTASNTKSNAKMKSTTTTTSSSSKAEASTKITTTKASTKSTTTKKTTTTTSRPKTTTTVTTTTEESATDSSAGAASSEEEEEEAGEEHEEETTTIPLTTTTISKSKKKGKGGRGG